MICPVESEEMEDGRTRRYPRISTIADPGRTPGEAIDDDTGLPVSVPKVFTHASVISAGIGRPTDDDNWCLCIVDGVDFTPLDADPQIIDACEETFPTWDAALEVLDQTPRDRGWKQGKLNRLKAIVKGRGAPDHDITLDMPFEEILNRIAATVHQRHGGLRGLRGGWKGH
jgi:hypothetical protein